MPTGDLFSERGWHFVAAWPYRRPNDRTKRRDGLAGARERFHSGRYDSGNQALSSRVYRCHMRRTGEQHWDAVSHGDHERAIRQCRDGRIRMPQLGPRRRAMVDDSYVSAVDLLHQVPT